MKIYLKGYYGYKNFGDEMLFFGLINYLYKHFLISDCVIEVEDVQRMKTRVERNHELLDIDYNMLTFVSIQQDKFRWQTHLKTFFGLSKYRKYTKIFGGGELFDGSKTFPHDGRNLLILFWYSVLQRNYLLIGGIGEATSLGAKFLQRILISRAKQVITRDKTSYQRVLNMLPKNQYKKVIAYHDFSFDIYPPRLQLTPPDNTILINAPYSSELELQIKKYQTKTTKKYFFPCEYAPDQQYFSSLQSHFPDIEIYDRTQHSLRETLHFLSQSRYGIGKRLHFCLSLHHYKVPCVCLSDRDKHRKLLLPLSTIFTQ